MTVRLVTNQPAHLGPERFSAGSMIGERDIIGGGGKTIGLLAFEPGVAGSGHIRIAYAAGIGAVLHLGQDGLHGIAHQLAREGYKTISGQRRQRGGTQTPPGTTSAKLSLANLPGATGAGTGNPNHVPAGSPAGGQFGSANRLRYADQRKRKQARRRS